MRIEIDSGAFLVRERHTTRVADGHAFVYAGETIHRDAIGKTDRRNPNGGRYLWCVVRCDGPGCDATVWIRGDLLSGLAEVVT